MKLLLVNVKTWILMVALPVAMMVVVIFPDAWIWMPVTITLMQLLMMGAVLKMTVPVNVVAQQKLMNVVNAVVMDQAVEQVL
jgi:hypothetical protein